jgi:pilus assembly protein Flp/PilA
MLSKISESVLGLLVRFRSEAGQALTEYGLILALIGVVAIVAVTAIGLAVSDTLDEVGNCLI